MLHIANPSPQNKVFAFREPLNNLVNYIPIPPGGQEVIGQAWTAEQTARVIEQIERDGGRDAAEAHGKMGRFAGLLYRDMGQISESEILMGHEAELRTREDRSVAEVTKAALGAHRAVGKATGQRPKARETKVEVAQELPRGQRPTGGEVRFDLEVTPEGRSDVRLPV